MGAALRRDTWSVRLAILGLTGLIFLGSLILVALPLAWLWFLSHLDLGYTEIYFLALVGCPTLIVGWVWILMLLNRLYRETAQRDPRPVLEASVTLAVLIGVTALVVWVLVLGAEGAPNRGPWPG